MKTKLRVNKNRIICFYSFLIILFCSTCLGGCDKENVSPSEPKLNEQDRQALIALRTALDADNNFWLNKWIVDDLSTYNALRLYYEFNLELNSETNEYQVVRIRLTPDAVTNKWYIPKEIGLLDHLEILSLYVRESEMIAPIPDELFDCPLRILALSGKGITGTIPLSIIKLKKILEELYISNTEISGELPKELCTLEKLLVLDLHRNNLSGDIFFINEQLTYFQLCENYFTSIDWRYILTPEWPCPFAYGNCFTGEVPQEVLSTNKWKKWGDRLLLPTKKGYGFTNAGYKD